jgi:hypothetical protein
MRRFCTWGYIASRLVALASAHGSQASAGSATVVGDSEQGLGTGTDPGNEFDVLEAMFVLKFAFVSPAKLELCRRKALGLVMALFRFEGLELLAFPPLARGSGGSL